jgi:hypothetical protein
VRTLKLAITLVLVILLGGWCIVPNRSYYTYEVSKDILYVDAVISDVISKEETTVLQPGIQVLRSGPFGVDFSGNLGIGYGVQISQQTVPEVHQVVFTDKEGYQFKVDKKAIYEEFKSHIGKKVRVAYQPHYRTKWSRMSCQEIKGTTGVWRKDFLTATPY